MKFDNIIIGAGLAGLTAAIRLAEEGRKVGLLSAGRSAMHFNSGSFGLLGYDAGHYVIDNPVESMASLPASHPYSRLSALSGIAALATEANAVLRRAGVKVAGNYLKNHMRLSPLGIDCPAWLTLDGLLTDDVIASLPRKHVAIVSLAGFMDFYPRFIAAAFESRGFKCDILTVDTSDLRRLRSSETEMRSSNLSRILHGDALDRLAGAVNDVAKGCDAAALVLPAVVDFDGDNDSLRLRQMVDRPLFYAPTMGISVPGIAIHSRMMRHFLSLGGRVLNGHRVIGADFDGNRLAAVFTDRLDGDRLVAEQFVIATGSFFSKGLVAKPDAIVEPALGLDTSAPADDRSGWFTADLLGDQPVMTAGIAVDANLRAMRGGTAVDNLYVAGSVLPGAASVREASGAGVALLSAVQVANTIINHN